MIQLQNINYSIGMLDLLKNASWNIQPAKRTALVGPNGAGKTTLLRILANEISEFDGKILAPKETQIGYLPQEEEAMGEGDILPLVLSGHTMVAAIEQEIVDIHHAMENCDNVEPLLKKLGPLEERFRQQGGYDLEARAKSILSGLGFSENDFERPISQFSGGWRMRVYLARLLLIEPDLLLLDEPTNHLDIESLEWLEQYLAGFPGSVVMVSHDRYFIDRLAHEIVELEKGILTRYTGTYDAFEKQKEETVILQIKQYEAQQEEIARVEKFIERFRYKATKAAQVQSRIKQLEKLERLELPQARSRIRFKLETEHPSHKSVLSMEKMCFKYDEDWVLNNIDLNLYRGERVAMVGVNGAGKTTFTRVMMGEYIPQAGKSELGGRVSVAYYAQHQIDALTPSATILEEVMDASGYPELKIRKILGVFHFSGDDVQKQISVLSGGEKARVSLAKMLARPANFLIMDEPTNHLDISSKKALEEALQYYDGTLLIISHDRYFLDKLVTRVLELKHGALLSYDGNYSDYLHTKMKCDEKVEIVNDRKVSESIVSQSGRKTKEQKRNEAQQRQEFSKERNVLKQMVENYEEDIALAEEEKELLEKKLADPQIYKQAAKASEMQKEYQMLQNKMAALYRSWELKQAEYEDVLGEINNLQQED
ncbi:ABC-F family ATP-binding cassette domain-containing protein [bacterium]|nr:ABC-F family ATP-binding cassette domain-containing protein [bacterium]